MKDELLKARVPQDMKDGIKRIATARGESEGVVLREAIKDYLLREDNQTPATVNLNKTKPVSYLKARKRKAP